MEDFFEFLLPVAICVVLPVLIVWIVANTRKNELDRKTEVMLKAIEAGVPVDANMFKSAEKQPKNPKELLLERLNGACVTAFMGTAFLGAGIYFTANPVGKLFLSPSMMIIAGSVLMAIGIALFIVYFTGKKMYAKELEEK